MKNVNNCLRLLSLWAEKGFFGTILMLLTLIVTANNELWTSQEDYIHTKQNIDQVSCEQARRTHLAVIDKYMKDREKWNTSVLGSWLFKLNKTVTAQKKHFLVHVHKEVKIENNHLKDCSVNNCHFTKNYELISIVDAVLVTLRHGFIPPMKDRRPRQRWIFMNEESPLRVYTYWLSEKNLDIKKDLANIFNWSMSYRSDSDIPYTYGRTVPLEEPVLTHFDLSALTEIIPNWKIKTRDVLLFIMVSHRVESKMNFLTDLQEFIAVDVVGTCSTDLRIKNRCPEHLTEDSHLLSKYLFYLALENSDCDEFLSEKIWHNAYTKGAIPVIMGPSLNDCERLLPPDSFIYIPKEYNVKIIEEFVERIKTLNEDDDALLSLHKWRNHFKVTFDYDYFGTKSVLLCRLCEGLNYNDPSIKIYDEADIKRFLDPDLLCRK